MAASLDIARAQIGCHGDRGMCAPLRGILFGARRSLAKSENYRQYATRFAILNADDRRYLKWRRTRADASSLTAYRTADIKIINFRNQLDAETGEAGISFKITVIATSVPFRIPGILGKTILTPRLGIAVGETFGINLLKIADNHEGGEITGTCRFCAGSKQCNRRL